MSNSNIIKYLISFGIPFIISLITARFMIACNIMDQPNARSSHKTPIPRSGGVATLAGFIAGLYFVIPFDSMSSNEIFSWSLLVVTMCSLAILGFLDDIKSLKAITRFGCQFLFALALVIFGDLAFSDLPLITTSIPLGYSGSLIAVLWLVAYTNAFNFMDGLNGMAGGTAIITALFIALLAKNAENVLLCKLALLLAVTTLGFLLFNFPQPRIFLGDVGSYFIGFAFAGFTLIGYKMDGLKLSPWLFLILYFTYLFDTGFTILRRLKKGENILSSHRGHLYQLLQQTGWSHSQVTGLYWGFACLQGIAAYSLQDCSSLQQLGTLAAFIAIGLIYAACVLRRAYHQGVLTI